MNSNKTWDATNRFDKRLDHIPEFFKGALVEVMDTAEAIKLWFEENKVAYTAADLAAFTEMVLQREKVDRGISMRNDRIARAQENRKLSSGLTRR